MFQAAGAEARCSCFERGGPARPLAQREHFLGGAPGRRTPQGRRRHWGLSQLSVEAPAS